MILTRIYQLKPHQLQNWWLAFCRRQRVTTCRIASYGVAVGMSSFSGFVVHMPLCLHVLFRVARPLHKNRVGGGGHLGYVPWGVQGYRRAQGVTLLGGGGGTEKTWLAPTHHYHFRIVFSWCSLGANSLSCNFYPPPD